MIGKATCVMKRWCATGHWVLFAFRDEEYPKDGQRQIAINTDDFEQMGSPDTITVTVEPGDTLNG